jgi:hypothetical protein
MILKLFYYANDSRFVQFDSIEKGCRNVKLPLDHLEARTKLELCSINRVQEILN